MLDLVTFNNTSDNPTASGSSPTRTITWLANDGTIGQHDATTTITIDPINSPPAFFLPPRPQLTYTEGAGVIIGRDEEFDPLQIVDIDGPTPIKGGTITISDGHIAGDRITRFDQASGFVFNDERAHHPVRLQPRNRGVHFHHP